MTFNYRIYGLQIRSTRQIRLLKESRNERIDLEVIWTTDAAETPDNLVSWERVTTKDLSGRKGISLFQSETEQGICSKIYFETDNRKLCFLLGAEKSRVWIIHDKDEPASDLDSNFVGPVLGCILRLRGTALFGDKYKWKGNSPYRKKKKREIHVCCCFCKSRLSGAFR
jgi:hypothetical protein